jgi:putative hemolysin
MTYDSGSWMSSESWLDLIVAGAALVVVGLTAVLEAITGLVPPSRARGGPAPGGDVSNRFRTLEGIIDPRRTLTTSLFILQAIALVIATLALDAIFRREFDGVAWIASPVIVVAMYLILAQALPRGLTRHRFDETTGALRVVTQGLIWPIRPLVRFSEVLGRVFTDILPAAPVEPMSREEELRSLIGVDGPTGMIDPDEREMIDAALRLEELTAREIMVPRVDIVAVQLDTPIPNLIDVIVQAGHSRIPVYEESIDQIVGVLHAKDLLPHLLTASADFVIAEHLRPTHIVPESKHLDVLLKELRRTRVHLAIIADEYGGTAGLVTIEDILEEIVGEIQDEYDTEQPLFEPMGPDEILADGRLPLENVETFFGITFPEDADFETVGGFVQNVLGRVPREGDLFAGEGLEGEIIEVEGRRVRRLRLARLTLPANEDQSQDEVPDGVGDRDESS